MSRPPLITVVPARALSPADRRRIIELCTAAFDESFERVFELLPGSTHVLAYRDAELVSHAAWVTRWLEPDGHAPLRAAYVESVATAPLHRGHGFATAVLRELQRRIVDHDVGALSPSDPAFYARLGWEPWLGPLAIRTTGGLLPTPDEGIMILRLPRTPPLDARVRMTAEWRAGELW